MPVAVMVLPTWAEVGAVSAGVGAATMVSGVDAAVAVRAGLEASLYFQHRRGVLSFLNHDGASFRQT